MAGGVEEIDLDPPGRGEVLIQIKAAGLCASDLVAINGERAKPTPMVIGHEAAGIIVELGPGVDSLEVGAHVVPSYVASCGRCEMCREGRPALCLPATQANMAGTMTDGTTRLHKDGVRIFHHSGVSAFAEFAVISQNALVEIDPNVPFDKAALFGCAVVTGVGSVVNTANVSPGQSTVIVGLGGVGLSAVLAAIASGAGRVIAVDINDDKLRLARQLGAHQAFNAKADNCVESIRAATDGGAHIAIETAGAPLALDLAYKVTRRGGTTIAAGMPGPEASITLSHLSLVGEVIFPPVQPGSSIMPGKVNPVMPMMILQIAYVVNGNDTATSMAALGGQLEINHFEPVIATRLFESIELLSKGVRLFRERCIEGLSLNRQRCYENLRNSAALATIFIPALGYSTVSQLVKEAD